MHTEQKNNSIELDIFEIVRSSQSNKFQTGCIPDTEAHLAGLNDHRPCSTVLLSPVLDTHSQWTWLSPRTSTTREGEGLLRMVSAVSRPYPMDRRISEIRHRVFRR